MVLLVSYKMIYFTSIGKGGGKRIFNWNNKEVFVGKAKNKSNSFKVGQIVVSEIIDIT